VDLTAVIVSYNSAAELRAALQSIADDAAGLEWEAIVVDNASRDDSVAVASACSPRVRVVSNRENVGFGRAVNQGVRASTAPLVLIMNPDCRLMAGATAAMRAELDREPACAIVGPRILDPDGSVQGSARGDPDMRRDAFEAVGGFDERYFMYWEDADLCRRLRAAGQHVRYVPQAVAVHHVGQSSKTAKAASIRAFHESAYLYYVTHVAPGTLSPKRILARALLAARQWWQLRGAA